MLYTFRLLKEMIIYTTPKVRISFSPERENIFDERWSPIKLNLTPINIRYHNHSNILKIFIAVSWYNTYLYKCIKYEKVEYFFVKPNISMHLVLSLIYLNEKIMVFRLVKLETRF